MNEMQKCKHESSDWNRAFVETIGSRKGRRKKMNNVITIILMDTCSCFLR